MKFRIEIGVQFAPHFLYSNLLKVQKLQISCPSKPARTRCSISVLHHLDCISQINLTFFHRIARTPACGQRPHLLMRRRTLRVAIATARSLHARGMAKGSAAHCGTSAHLATMQSTTGHGPEWHQPCRFRLPCVCSHRNVLWMRNEVAGHVHCCGCFWVTALFSVCTC